MVSTYSLNVIGMSSPIFLTILYIPVRGFVNNIPLSLGMNNHPLNYPVNLVYLLARLGLYRRWLLIAAIGLAAFKK